MSIWSEESRLHHDVNRHGRTDHGRASRYRPRHRHVSLAFASLTLDQIVVTLYVPP